MKVATKVQTSKRRVILSAVLALMLSLMMVPAMAFGTSPADADYSLSVYNTGGTALPDEDGQHAVVTIDLGGAVSLDPLYAGHYLDNLTIMIAGTSITDPSYTRPTTVSTNGNDLIIDISGVVDSSGQPAFTADYSGILELRGNLQGVDVDKVEYTDPLYYKSVLPVGFTWTENTEGSATAQVTITSKAQVRGMFHTGIYTEGAGGELIPVYTGPTDSSPILVRTYTSHAHDFVNMTPDDLAKAVVSSVLADPNFDQSTYTISAPGGGVVTVGYALGSSGPSLYLYFFDDSLVHRVDDTYAHLSDPSVDGVLPRHP
jgi:hypothetical protein